MIFSFSTLVCSLEWYDKFQKRIFFQKGLEITEPVLLILMLGIVDMLYAIAFNYYASFFFSAFAIINLSLLEWERDRGLNIFLRELSVLQSVTPHLSFGGEVFWAGQHRKSGIGYAARYNTDKMVCCLQFWFFVFLFYHTIIRKKCIYNLFIMRLYNLARRTLWVKFWCKPKTYATLVFILETMKVM